MPGDSVSFRLTATRHGVVRSAVMLLERDDDVSEHECFLRIFLSAWQQLSILHAQVDLRVDIDASLIALDAGANAPSVAAPVTPRGGSPRPSKGVPSHRKSCRVTRYFALQIVVCRMIEVWEYTDYSHFT